MFLELGLALVLGTGGAALVTAYRRHSLRTAFLIALAGDERFALEQTAGRVVAFTTRRPLRHLGARALVDENTTWFFTTQAPLFSARTTLQMVRRGFTGKVSEAIGWRDVDVGDPALDGTFGVRSTDPDVLRGVCATPAVRGALHRVAASGALRVDVASDGRMIVSIATKLDAAVATAAALAVVALADALDDNAHAPALSRSLASGVGGASGNPFGVPLLGGRR